MDPTRSLGFMQDATLSEFFQRPISLVDVDWEVNTPLFLRFNPWELFWENPRNAEKIKNYYLLKCTMHIKLLINGNAFYYGRSILGYEPLSPLDNSSATALLRPDAYVNQDLVRLSQRMHVYINPTESTGGSLELPFFCPNNCLRIPLREWRTMGECVLMEINSLQHANGGTDPLTIRVLAWAENVSYAIPTAATPANVPEMGGGDEHEQAVISRPASTVARIARSLTNIPMIGPFARATEIGATAIAAVAKIFGYSSPVELDYGIMVPNPRPSLAVVDAKYPTNKLAVDSKQEVTIDPSTTGISATDELPIASIAGRESYLTSFDWDTEYDPDRCLYQQYVDPFATRANGAERHFTACAAAVLPFDYWRGTMRFRFQIVASNFHKGRIRIVYDPYGGVIDPEYNTHYTTIHDISMEKDFTVDIGWAQHVPYRRPIGPTTPFSVSDTVPLPPLRNSGNGVLSVHVLNKLTTPGTVVSNIQVNVFVSMLDDFEVAMPNSDLGRYRFRNPNPPARQTRSITEPEMGEDSMGDMDCCEAPITDPPTIDTMADALIETPDTTKLFFGEVVASFRQLMKRTCLSEVVLVGEQTTSTIFSLTRRAFPEYGGNYDGGAFGSSLALTYTNGSQVVPYATTYLNYLGRMFIGWRGSVRWTFDTSTLNVSGGGDLFNSLTLNYSRTDSTARTTNSLPLPPTGLPVINIGPDLVDTGGPETLKGCYLGNSRVNPVQSVEVPFYSAQRFLTTLEEPAFDTIVTGPAFNLSVVLPSSANAADISVLRMFTSAGEDLNFFFFNGLPPMYFQPTLPSDPGP
jgi:hypothetical protein